MAAEVTFKIIRIRQNLRSMHRVKTTVIVFNIR